MSFEYSIYDEDIGGVVDTQQFSDANTVFSKIMLDLNSYECDEEFADDAEIAEAKKFDVQKICNMIKTTLMNPFFGEISVWTPGHHRKFKIEKKI